MKKKIRCPALEPTSTISLSTPVENSEATWEKATKIQQTSKWNLMDD